MIWDNAGILRWLIVLTLPHPVDFASSIARVVESICLIVQYHFRKRQPTNKTDFKEKLSSNVKIVIYLKAHEPYLHVQLLGKFDQYNIL